MATRNQKGWVGRGPVVSMRVEPELVERLDVFAARTNRSRSGTLVLLRVLVVEKLCGVIGKRLRDVE